MRAEYKNPRPVGSRTGEINNDATVLYHRKEQKGMRIEEFIEFLKEIYPLIEQVQEKIVEAEVPRLVSITMDASGYLSVDAHGTGCAAYRAHKGDSLTLNIKEKL